MLTSLLLRIILALNLSSGATKADPMSAEDNVAITLPSCRADFPSVLATLTFFIPFYINFIFFYGIGGLDSSGLSPY